MKQTKITHLTSAHPRYDTRIFLKQCSSLVKIKGYKVSLIVADGNGNELKNDVSIFDVGKLKGRLNRIFNTTKKVLNKAIELDSDIYHFHDPELIPIGLKLKKLGKKVIFDIHENIALQIKDKEYLNYFIRNSISYVYRYYEKKSLVKFDTLILAENSYLEYYKKITNKYTIVLNMPDIQPLEEFYSIKRLKNELFYIGGISNDRGLDVTVSAIKILKKDISDIFMHYVGNTYNNILESVDLKSIEKNIKFYGSMPLFKGLELSRDAKVGLSILKPIDNYMKSYSTKIFEYMALGLPVVTSDFKLYKDVIEKYNCGICVNPLNPKEIADAIKYIIDNPKEAEQMGINGRNAVLEKYNWAIEEEKLYNVYKQLENRLILNTK
ncbi:MAG: glycosyltransferase family 1 protein [Epsilonproteobacteria bacterium]|nr:MAG: glycosyltransferase family 1 protein [Campylobacterota bacterium]